MKELDLQDKYLIHFLTQRRDGLQYREVKANTVSSRYLIIEEDLKEFISSSKLNKSNYKKLLKQYDNENALMAEFMDFLFDKIKRASNMAIFINSNKSVTFKGLKFHLFYPSGSVTEGDQLFEENIFSVVQELPYIYKHEGKTKFSFRPDLTFFVNGLFLGYSELKSTYNNQNARRNGRKKVATDYQKAVSSYLDIAQHNDVNKDIKNDMLKIFEKAIHITCTDINNTYIIRNIDLNFEELKSQIDSKSYSFDNYQKAVKKTFKEYPLLDEHENRVQRFEEVFRAHYSKKMIEKEILYYNFIEREFIKKEGSKEKEYKHHRGRLISPRPKQKFGTDKIITKVEEFLEHEQEPDYFINKLKKELKHLSKAQQEELILKRSKYQNNKHVYSLLLQYAAGFGKSNIIGWAALQLKDLRKEKQYIYDKILLVVDRVQLRDQLDTKMYNMNINNSLFLEADNKKSFLRALNTDVRIVVVNLQKFASIKDVLDTDVVERLAEMRIAFLIDEVHRSQKGVQHEEMVTLFDELQSSFDNNEQYKTQQKKKNLIIGFTATPSDHTLARFGEFNKYAEGEKIWIPFDSYTMKEAILDGYILNPIAGLVAVSSKMYFELPENILEGFEDAPTHYERSFDKVIEDTEYNKNYRVRKKKIYEDEERIEAISKFVVERLLSTVYPTIRGTGKAMLAASSIKAAIKYKRYIQQYFDAMVQENKYSRFKDAPVYIVYSSDGQTHQSATTLNGNLSEAKVLQNFAHTKNGIIIVVAKLQTGFDEPKLQTLFLDKEIRGINAIQTISRVNRTTKYKNDCKVVDFSYKNVNIDNINKAFEHFSNLVVSDFNPLGDEKRLDDHYQDLIVHPIYTQNFNAFTTYNSSNSDDIKIPLDFGTNIDLYLKVSPEEAKNLKSKVNQYFRILNLIESVIQIEDKHKNKLFLEFWRRFNNEYNNIKGNESDDILDDVEIYFDNKIGIVAPDDYINPPTTGGKPEDDDTPTIGGGQQLKLNIELIIKKLNAAEAEIEAKIKDFEDKVELLFDYMHKEGKRLIAKIKDTSPNFDANDIYDEFNKLYRSFVRRNKAELGAFFIKESKALVNQFCDEFERRIKQ